MIFLVKYFRGVMVFMFIKNFRKFRNLEVVRIDLIFFIINFIFEND